MHPVTANNNNMFKNIHTDNIVSFFGGDFLATIISTSFISELDWIHPTLKLIFVIVGGVAGGFSGLLGQRIFKYLEKKYDDRK